MTTECKNAEAVWSLKAIKSIMMPLDEACTDFEVLITDLW